MSVTIHADMMEAASYYEDGADLIYALLRWAEFGEEPDACKAWYPTFIAFKSRVQLSKEAHDNGAKGGRPKKVQNPPIDSGEIRVQNPPFKDSGNLKSREENSGEGVSDRRFKPPTIEEVSQYSEESGNAIDAGQFVDFYSSKGWKVGKSPMKDWKAAVRNWARRNNPKPKLKAYDGGAMLL